VEWNNLVHDFEGLAVAVKPSRADGTELSRFVARRQVARTHARTMDAESCAVTKPHDRRIGR
jgi:hypothetical protein